MQNIVSILRAISREPQIGSFSLVAFNMQEERVIFEQHNAHRIDFPRLGRELEAIEGGMVDISQLADEDSASYFLTDLLTKEMSEPDPGQGARPDAVIILGPKLMLEKKISKQVLLDNPWVNSPVFYLIYNTDPFVYPWQDAISNVLKIYKGFEYTISLPKDFGHTIGDINFFPTRHSVSSLTCGIKLSAARLFSRNTQASGLTANYRDTIRLRCARGGLRQPCTAGSPNRSGGILFRNTGSHAPCRRDGSTLGHVSDGTWEFGGRGDARSDS